MGNTFYFEWEVQFMIWLQHLVGNGKVISLFSTLCALVGNEVFMVAVLAVIYLGVNKKQGAFIGINIVTALGLGSQLKNIVFRRRPYFDHREIECLLPVNPAADLLDISAQGFSFPSMHSMNSLVIYGSVARWLKKKWISVLAVMMTICIGFSRIVVGVHYPTDVLAGWLIGLVVMISVSWLQTKLKKQWMLYLIIIVINLPGLFFCQTKDYFVSIGVIIGFVVSLIFEEKLVRFEDTKNGFHVFLRVFFAMIVFLGITTLVKLPFSSAFLESASLGAHMVSTFRYMLGVFVTMGIYPILFKKIKILQ